jgi:peptide deformylase
MGEILVEKKGIGLAAPQAGVPLRLFIVSLTGKREDVRAYINPTVTPHGDLDEAEEGCLSVPGIWAKIRRYKRATVTATDLGGRQFTEDAEGLYARCLQHEYDHIEGTVIVNRMGEAARITHRRQLKKLADEHEGK